MSTRPNPLRAAMLSVRVGDAHVPEAAPERGGDAARGKPPSRAGKRAIGAHFEPNVQRQLRILAAEMDRTTQDLIGEALNDLFRKYNKSAIAS